MNTSAPSAPVPTPAVPPPPRLDGEPGKWHARFLAFALMPPGRRSLEAAWRQENETANTGAAGAPGGTGQRPPGAWHRAYARFRWEERAAEHDAATFSAEAEEVAATRRAERTRRRAVVGRFLRRAEELLEDATAFRLAPAAVSAAVARAVEISRREFGADPDPDATDKDGVLLLTAGASAPVCIVTITGGPLPVDEVPPEGQIEEETDGI